MGRRTLQVSKSNMCKGPGAGERLLTEELKGLRREHRRRVTRLSETRLEGPGPKAYEALQPSEGV